MKGTEHFKEIIQNYLEQRKAEDALFREKAERVNRPIDDIITAILNYVQKSGCCGYSDEEIYGLATHFAEEETIEIGKPIQGPHGGRESRATSRSSQTLSRRRIPQTPAEKFQTEDG